MDLGIHSAAQELIVGKLITVLILISKDLIAAFTFFVFGCLMVTRVFNN